MKDQLRRMSGLELFTHRTDVNEEISERAKRVLMESGYDWYKVNSISVVSFERARVTIIAIHVDVEHNFQHLEYKLEVPLPLFDMMSQTKRSAE